MRRGAVGASGEDKSDRIGRGRGAVLEVSKIWSRARIR
jgi:hypothetical protein